MSYAKGLPFCLMVETIDLKNVKLDSTLYELLMSSNFPYLFLQTLNTLSKPLSRPVQCSECVLSIILIPSLAF